MDQHAKARIKELVMAKKSTAVKTVPAAKAEVSKTPVMKSVAPVSSAVRNSPIPKVAAPMPAKKEITHDDIALRAYYIHCSGQGGSEMDNWQRAERELRGM
jgi:hypothetical protein